MNIILHSMFRSPNARLPLRCKPGLRYGPSPEQAQEKKISSQLDYFVRCINERLASGYQQRVIERQQVQLDDRIDFIKALCEEDAQALYVSLRNRHRSQTNTIDTTIDALAHACVAAERALSLNPHKGQRQAATAMLLQRFVEMPTGEGKTLAIALAAAVTACGDTPVHVLTANDYLAERDAKHLTPFYAALNLSCGCVLPTMDDKARRVSYRSNVVYVTGKQAGFDWMRDALTRGPSRASLVNRLGSLTAPAQSCNTPLLQRGLCAAILDEADSLLLDEARTPLVLASPAENSSSTEQEGSSALALAQMLDAEADYHLNKESRLATLTDPGKVKLEQLAQRMPGVWRASRYRDERVRQALVALHLWQLDHDYIVLDKEVLLVDEQTGRALPGRRLQHGLHGLLELKERCQLTPENQTIASIAFQSFFLRYKQLVGTSATLAEVRGELARVYQTTLTEVRPQQPTRLLTLPARLFLTRLEQLAALIEVVRSMLAVDRPMLIGTRSVEQSRGVSAMLQAHGIQHSVLDAKQDEDEVAIVAQAGQAGRITVATNMAGRGTDIPLGDGVAARGGLHLVSLAFNDSRRVDRQLAGRTARQGDPGSFQQFWTLDDPALQAALPVTLMMIARRLIVRSESSSFTSTLVLMLVRIAQLRLERRHATERRHALVSRERLARHVALDGHSEHPV